MTGVEIRIPVRLLGQNWMEPKIYQFLQHFPKSQFLLKDVSTYCQILPASSINFSKISNIHIICKSATMYNAHFPSLTKKCQEGE